jgi:MFS transporter, PPP family, 3-phenylpropionic acid transporter
MSRKDAYPWRFSLFLAAYYTANSVYQGFISVYFSGKGLDSAQIGMLMSAISVVSILSQTTWGALGDRSTSRNRVLRIMCALAAGTILLLPMSDNLWYMSLVLCLFAASYTAIQPMGDSVILESLQERRQSFGPIRLLGTYSFAVASIIAGRLMNGHLERVPWLTALVLAFVFLSTFYLPPAAGHARKKSGASMITLLRDKKLMRLIALVTLLQTTLGYFYVFFPVYFTKLPGGSPALLGWAFFLSAASETPFLIFIDKLFNKLGAGKLLLISAASLIARWLILALTNNVWVAMASQLLHGWGFIVMTVTMAKYISLTVPEELRTRGQMLLAISGFGVARVAGNLGGGLVAQAIGLQATFGVMAALALISLIVFAPTYLKRKPA